MTGGRDDETPAGARAEEDSSAAPAGTTTSADREAPAMTRDEAFAAISAERDRQAALWAGPHAHGQGDCSSPGVPLMVKIAALAEECGEVARAALDGKPAQMRAELVQVAAVAVAMLEGDAG